MNLDTKLDEMTIEGELKQFGFIPPTIEPDHYVLGGTELPKVILREDGEWGAYLPIYESQYNHNFDSYGCTTFGTLNGIEMMIKQISNKEINLSERYPYNIVGITPVGADPHVVCEAIRKNGSILQDSLPFTSTLEEFCTPRPMTQKYLDEGAKWGWNFKHQWVWTSSIGKEKRTTLIREYLKYSPLLVSVTGWFKQGDVYIDNGQPNTHWTVIFGEEKGKGWKCFDSYDPGEIKIISYDHNIMCAKFIQVTPKAVELQVSWLQKLLNAIKEAINTIVNNIPVPEPVVEPEIKHALLDDFCLAIKAKEGWYVGSRSYRNNNPGNLKYASQWKATGKDTQGFAIFPDYASGYEALVNMVKNVIAGKSKVYNKECTILEFFEIYAPKSDNNDPLTYAQFVAKRCGIDVNYKLKYLI